MNKSTAALSLQGSVAVLAGGYLFGDTDADFLHGGKLKARANRDGVVWGEGRWINFRALP
jgi:hypothetical protein